MSVSFFLALALAICTSQAASEWEDIDFRQRYQPRLRRENSDNDDDFIPPTMEELTDAFRREKVAGWQPSDPGYDPLFTIKIHNSQTVPDRKVQHKIDEKDPNYTKCNVSGFVECAECEDCEREVAAFDSCGLMTKRICYVVTLNKAKYQGICEDLKQECDDPKCLKFVEKVIDPTPSKNKCTDYKCQPINATECESLFGTTEFIIDEFKKECSLKEFENTDCKHRFRDPKPKPDDKEFVKKCDAGCRVKVNENETCTLKPPEHDHISCNSLPIEGYEESSDIHFCRTLANECGERKCLNDIPLGEHLTVSNGKVKCKNDCLIEKVTQHEGRCAKEIVCKEGCRDPAKCPLEGQPSCYDLPIEVVPDKCQCDQPKCAVRNETCNFVPPKCPSGQTPKTSPDLAECCPKNLWPDLTHTTCLCQAGSGPLCCLGPGCDLSNCQRDEDNKDDFKKCCPRDERGCLKRGGICIITSPHNGSYGNIIFRNDKEKCNTSFCPDPHKTVKPNPMCCVGENCNKTECETLQNCCSKGECCKMYNSEEQEWQLVGRKCAEECSTHRHCKDCYTIKDDGSANVCPEGKCCCRNNFELVVADCVRKRCPLCSTNRSGKDCHTIEEGGSVDVCSEGKCCCRNNFELVVVDCALTTIKGCPPCSTNTLGKDCHTIKEDGSVDVCSEGKCCCQNNFEQKEVDCPATQPPGPTTTTSGPIISPETTPSVSTGVTFTTSSGVVITTTLGPTSSYKTESITPSGSTATEGTRGPSSTSSPTGQTTMPISTSPSVGSTSSGQAKKTCTIKEGIEYLGNDIGGPQAGVTNLDECISKCIENEECQTLTFTIPNGPCYLKRAITANVATRPGKISAICIPGFSTTSPSTGVTSSLYTTSTHEGSSTAGSTSSIHTTTRSYVPSTTTHVGSTTSGPSGGTTTKPTGTTTTGRYAGTTTTGLTGPTPPGNTTITSCKDLEDPYTDKQCCWGENCCVGDDEERSCCPKGKACCDDEGTLLVIGNHCCKGDGCCALGNGRKDCCYDPGSCCGTGCFKHCRVTQEDGKDGFYDHIAKGVVGESTCACRPDVKEEVCENNVKKRWKPKECFVLKTDVCYKYTETKCETTATEKKCETTESKCEREVCKPHQPCPSPLSNFLRAIRFARSP